MNKEKMIAFGDFLAVFFDVSMNIAYTLKRCQEIINTSDNEEEISKAKRNYAAAKKAKEGIKNYNNLKDSPLYKPIFEHYRVDKLNETMVNLCKL